MTSCRLPIRVVPNAARDDVAGWVGDSIKVRIRARAIEGRANEALVGFLADRLGLNPRAVVLLRGEKSRQKLVEIEGLGLTEALGRLGVSVP
jgi:uncharacterized protein (TIGR00251 family)